MNERDGIRAQLFVVGTVGNIGNEDVANLAKLFDEKIVLNLQ